jgi:hypothetical protein
MDSEGWDPDASEGDWAAAFKDAYKEDPPADIEPLGAVLFFFVRALFWLPIYAEKRQKRVLFLQKGKSHIHRLIMRLNCLQH